MILTRKEFEIIGDCAERLEASQPPHGGATQKALNRMRKALESSLIVTVRDLGYRRITGKPKRKRPALGAGQEAKP